MSREQAPHDEAERLTRARKGDEEAFRELVERHSTEVFRLAWRLTGNRENAEDVVQETFLKAYRSLHRFDARSSFGTWLYRIASNCALDLLRRGERQERGREEPGDEDRGDPFEALQTVEPGPLRRTLSSEIERRVADGLGQLTPMERTAFVLRHFEEHSISEIGRALGTRTSATKQAVFRAVGKLRKELLPWVEESHARTA